MKPRKYIDGSNILIGSLILISSLFLLFLPTSSVDQGRHIVELCSSFGLRFFLLILVFRHSVKERINYGSLYILICCVFSIITIYATAYKITGLRIGTSDVNDIGNCLYFSIITWTTVGYGDIAPFTPYAKGLASSEALIGSVSMALTIAAFIKAFESYPLPAAEIAPSVEQAHDVGQGQRRGKRQRVPKLR